MGSHLLKMFFVILCLAFGAHLIQGASQCGRTNSNPSNNCKDDCTVQTGCRNPRKKCLCDGDCGYSCIYPRIRCSKPKKVRNGVITFKSYRFNGTQSVTCKPGFKLTGSAVRRCRGIGYWDGKQPRCRRPQKACPDPGKTGLLLRTTGTRKSFQPGKKLRYYCPDKFTLRGSRDLVCKKDGTWTASLPQCIAPKCSVAVLPSHTKVFSPKNWKKRRNFGTRLLLSCEHGYAAVRRGILICSVPEWRLEPSSFRCIPKSCPNPGRPRNGDVKGLFRFGERVRYTCDQCYKLKGPSYRECQADQQWTDTLPTCEPVTCSSLKKPGNGYLSSNSQECGRVVQYHCDSGYQLIGQYSRRCRSDGTWSGNEPACQAVGVTPAPTAPAKTSLPTKIVLQTSKAPTTKLKIHTTTVSPTTVPKTSSGINSRCGQPYLPPKARVRLVRGDTLYLVCNEKHSTLKLGKMRCVGSRWSVMQAISCLAKACPDPGVPENGYKDGVSYFIGDVVRFSCDDCHRLNGSLQRTCLINTTWTGTRTRCVVKTCPPLKDTKQATVSQISRECKAIATYTCKNKSLTMLGSGEKICNTSGMWEGAEPQCVIPPKVNIARGKPVSVSSFFAEHSGPRSIAVDGNRHGKFLHTKWQHEPWIKIDLEREEPVSTVIVVNRRDCCIKRINGFRVYVGNKGKSLNEMKKNAICGSRSIAKGGPNIIQCPRTLRGRYVIVHLPYKRWSYTTMALHEIEVYRK